MKKLLLLALVTVSASLKAQNCTPNSIYDNSPAGLYPSTLDIAYNNSQGNYLSQIDIITNTDTCVTSPLPLCLYIKGVRISSVDGLPNGWVCAPTYNGSLGGYNAWLNSGIEPNIIPYHGCFTINASAQTLQTTSEGTYNLTINFDWYAKNQDLQSPLLAQYTWTSSIQTVIPVSYQLIVQNCTYTLVPNNYTANWSETSTTVNVNSSGNCTWSIANPGCNWITGISPSTNTGSGQATINFTQNTSINARSCTLALQNQSFTLNQNGRECSTTPEICLVTVDPTTGYNNIIWNENSDISYYKIFKQNSQTSNFDSVASVSISNLSSYVDLTSNPSQQSNSYKISGIDTCGNTTLLSQPHTTIHLSANQGVNNEVNLLWNAYAGFSYNNFEIYRSNNNGPFNLIGSTANSSFSYTDLNPPAGINYYYVAVSNPNGCNPSKAITKAYSNVLDGAGNAVILALNEYSALNNISISPNPAQNSININLGKDSNSNVNVQVFNALGQLVSASVFDKNGGHKLSMDVSTLPIGIYFVKVQAFGGMKALRLVKN